MPTPARIAPSRPSFSLAILVAALAGRAVDLNDAQKVLAAKYREKYRRAGNAPAGRPGTQGDPP